MRMNKHSVSPPAGAVPGPAGLPIAWFELAAGLGVLLVLLAGLVVGGRLPGASVVLALFVYAGIAALVTRHWPAPRRSLGPANRVTLGRSVLVATLAGALAGFPLVAQHAGLLAGMAFFALMLDGVDGWVARRWHCASDFGARFDMELDALLMLVLCGLLWLLDKAGLWVIAIGAMRYLFVLAMYVWPWLDAGLPDSRRRKGVCVWQVASLLLCLLPAVRGSLATALLVVALALLALSFAVDVRWLYRQRAVSSN